MSSPYHLTEFFPGKRLPAVCRDGVTRSAVITGQPDTFFSLPAAVQVTVAGKRRTVSGFLTHDEAGMVCFRAYLYRSNHALIPATKHRAFRSKIARRLLSVVYAYNYRNGISWGVTSDYCEAVGEWLKDWANGDRRTLAGWQGRRELRRLSPDDCRLMSAYLFRVARYKYTRGE